MSSVVCRASSVPVLEIDLSSGKVEKLDLGSEMREKYLGGRGIQARLLYDYVGPETDALSPDNVLIFGTGVFAGAGVPGGIRLNISAKSPSCVFGYSNVGGFLATEVRKAGYDHIVIKGKAKEPVLIWIEDDKVEIRSAAHLWGKGTGDTARLIKEELGDPKIRTAVIGPAGEKLANVANIIVSEDRGSGSRLASVMGSKNLKAMAVKGSGNIELANKDRVRELSRDLVKRIKEQPIYQARSAAGSAHTPASVARTGSLPVRNLTSTDDPAIAGLGQELMKSHIEPTSGCPSCPIRHHFKWEVKEGPYAGTAGVGLEGGVITVYGAVLGNPDGGAVFKLGDLANDYGIDAYESACVIAAAAEWLQKGIVTKDDLDGIELKFGDPDSQIQMLHKMAKREGIGDVLAEGVVKAAEKIGNGAIDCISYSKGRTSGILDYRVLKGGLLGEVTSIPSCEMKDGWTSAEEVMGNLGAATPEFKDKILKRFGTLDPIDQLSYNKTAAVAYCQDVGAVMDSVDLCLFVTEWAMETCTLKDAADLFQAVTGLDMGEEDLIKAAERIRDLERAFWVREGYTRKDDRLHGKIATEAVLDGPFKGERLHPEKMEKMLDEYYELRGWDIETGIPTKETLLRDGLEDVVEDLEKMGKL